MEKILKKVGLGSSDEGAPAQEPSQEEVQGLREKYEKAGQEQVFTFYDELNTAEKAGLVERLSTINPEYINQIMKKALNPPKEASKEETKLAPPP